MMIVMTVGMMMMGIMLMVVDGDENNRGSKKSLHFTESLLYADII